MLFITYVLNLKCASLFICFRRDLHKTAIPTTIHSFLLLAIMVGIGSITISVLIHYFTFIKIIDNWHLKWYWCFSFSFLLFNLFTTQHIKLQWVGQIYNILHSCKIRKQKKALKVFLPPNIFYCDITHCLSSLKYKDCFFLVQ